MDFDSPVLCPACSGTVIGDRAALAEAEIVGPEDRNAILLCKISANGFSSSFSKLIVVRYAADIIGKTGNFQDVIGPPFQLSCELVQLGA